MMMLRTKHASFVVLTLLVKLQDGACWSSQPLRNPIVASRFMPFRCPSVHCTQTDQRETPGKGQASNLTEIASDHTKAFEVSVLNRYACKKFQRADGTESDSKVASVSDPAVVQTARHALDLARLSPSAFNTQPYRIVLVHSTDQKLALSRFCLGPNRQRVLDSDCTAVFLADRQILKTIRRLAEFSQAADPHNRPLRKLDMLYLSVFSSGYPIPRFLSSAISFLLRVAVGTIDFFLRRIVGKCEFPSLSSSETWASKQVAMVAMTYMLACSASGLATIPMEGINASGIRKVLKVPQSRYAVPLLVSTGKALTKNRRETSILRRYPRDEVISENFFGFSSTK